MAVSEAELPGLEALFGRGRANGVRDLAYMDPPQFAKAPPRPPARPAARGSERRSSRAGRPPTPRRARLGRDGEEIQARGRGRAAANGPGPS